VGVFSRAFLVFLKKESKKRRRKQPGKLMAKPRSQAVNLPGARPLMNPLHSAVADIRISSLIGCSSGAKDKLQAVSQCAS